MIKIKEFMMYINMIKEVLDRSYGKEVVFYNDGEWYSRDHSRNITIEELREYLLKKTYREEDEGDCLCSCCETCGGDSGVMIVPPDEEDRARIAEDMKEFIKNYKT